MQFMVLQKGSLEPVGLVTAYNPSLREGWAYAAGLTVPSAMGSGLILEGLAVLTTYLFDTWPLRKVYFETIEFNLAQFGALPGDLFIEEGRFRSHIYYRGRYWDVVTLCVYATDWQANDWVHRLRGEWNYSADTDVMGLEEFSDLVIRECDPLAARGTIGTDQLLEEFGFDSLSMVILASMIEELSGARGNEWTAEVKTLRDAYSWYCTAMNWPREEPPNIP